MYKNSFTGVQISKVEIFGLEAKQIEVPKWLKDYDSTPLWSYNIFLKYEGKYCSGPRCNRRLSIDRCILSLRTNIKRYADLAVIKGRICLKNHSENKVSDINFVPKQELLCPQLELLISEYAGRNSLSDWVFDDALLSLSKNSVFSCNRDEVPLIEAYNRDNLLDRISVDMNLFQPANS